MSDNTWTILQPRRGPPAEHRVTIAWRKSGPNTKAVFVSLSKALLESLGWASGRIEIAHDAAGTTLRIREAEAAAG